MLLRGPGPKVALLVFAAVSFAALFSFLLLPADQTRELGASAEPETSVGEASSEIDVDAVSSDGGEESVEASAVEMDSTDDLEALGEQDPYSIDEVDRSGSSDLTIIVTGNLAGETGPVG